MAWNQPGNNGQDRDPWGAANLAATLREMAIKGGREQGAAGSG